MAVVVAFFGGTIPILTRKLKDIPASIMMFYMGLLGSILMAVLIGAEAYYNKSELHTVSYTGEQFFLIITSTIFSAIATSSYTIAYQSDTAGFIVLIGNVKLIYFFLSDTLIFNEVFSVVELVSVSIILVVVISVTLYKIREKNKKIEESK